MAAEVQKSAQLSLSVSSKQDFGTPELSGYIVVLVRQLRFERQKSPRALEDCLHLELEDLWIDKDSRVHPEDALLWNIVDIVCDAGPFKRQTFRGHGRTSSSCGIASPLRRHVKRRCLKERDRGNA